MNSKNTSAGDGRINLTNSNNRQILVIQTLGFMGIILFLWLDELLDFPNLLFGFQKTPFNWPECITETLLIAFFGYITLRKTKSSLERIRTLEGLLPICASCKKIRNEQENWISLEHFITKNSEASFTHSICPECSERLYGEFL
ncbi:MAG: hypothetical protein CVV64_04915 [Candidatus Wallbacteria bacterium HGW-Wallbacteria-1]|jgi:hypothetical protein|uniref:Uncharacterized protein n=1 Tax=Candidatus Wallbacteria bacterium HGW-Wallbacteria-1 TaxID=2013854 RepID=A0A2N1PS03_9BACT|nr:MAG: hypothetical protein CVV64_04915 [Candidatus Wallbacteria bacterium HGW-Wallbacteria-1]